MSASRFLLLASLISPLLHAEDMLPAYERAVKHLPAQATKLIRNATIDPVWIKGQDSFVYRRQLPGETKETIEETIRFAAEINPHTIQVSLAAPYPGTELYRQAVSEGWLDIAHAELIDDNGVQIAPLHYPHLSHTEIFESLETFYKRFYFRRKKIASLVAEMIRSPDMMRRRLREGVEFFQFLRHREMAG
jgi:hypothetical protein